MNPTSLDSAARNLQLLVGALMLGILAFGAVILTLAQMGQLGLQADVLVPALLAGVSLVSVMPTQVIAHLVLNRNSFAAAEPGNTSQSPIDDSAEAHTARLLAMYFQAKVIAGAGLEGAALMNLVGYALAAQWWSLIVPTAAITWMATTFPTKDRIAHWLEHRIREVPGYY